MEVPMLKLNTGAKLPIVGLGTYASSGGEITQAIIDAINAGYRHFDCAHFYGNEEEVGAGIRAKIQDGTVKREELFITSKLWNTFHLYELVVPTCKLSLKNLGLDYVDLYLIHWPFGWQEGKDMWPMKNGRILCNEIDYLQTWKGMETCYNLGLAKNIGLSNFNSEQIDRVIAHTKINPVVNQIEANPYLNQKKLIEFCRMRDIAVIAYCPLGKPSGSKSLLTEPIIVEVAKKYGKTSAQIILKYLVCLGVSVIPKSVTKSRIIENINIFDFDLKKEDLALIDKLNKNYRICGLQDLKNHPYYPFNIEF